MRFLIDGYNVMYAGGLLGKRFGPDGFRKVRTRFLNDLAAALGPMDASLTCVVFDASQAIADAPKSLRYKGLSIVFAVEDEDADARIERLIGEHSAPKKLTVVSSDRRIRLAANRRRSAILTADEFWVRMHSRRKEPLSASGGHVEAPSPVERAPAERRAEADHWIEMFGHLDDSPETRRALNADPVFLSDSEIDEIEREVEREFGPT